MDTAVGRLYSFLGGSNGTRAMAFFQCCCVNLLESKLQSTLPSADFEKGCISMLMAVRELLRREQPAVFSGDLPDLIDSIEDAINVGGVEAHSMAFQLSNNMLAELHGMMARAQALIQQDEVPAVEGVSATVVCISPGVF